MKSNIRKRLERALALGCACTGLAMFSVAAQAQSAGIAPEAKQILKASTDSTSSRRPVT